MQWKELESDIRLFSLMDLLGRLDCLSSLYAMSNLSKGIRIYALRSCEEAVLNHVRSCSKEVGGLLLGCVYQTNMHGNRGAEAITILTKSIPSIAYRNSSVSIEMDTEVWGRANEHFLKGNVVVGWYHSHPNLGAFF